jgi:transposase InsO family protein
MAMGRKLMETVVNIVKPTTILAWQRRLEKAKWDYSQRRKRKPGRPRIPGNVEELICKIARENVWGYKKIQGELKKLGIEISKTTPPSPDHQGLTWREFLSRHADVFLCADLLTKEIWTLKGVLNKYKDFFNQHRPHQGIGNCIPEQLGHQMGDKAQDFDSNSVHTSDIWCHEFLGGLLKSYIRRAA